MTSNEHKKHSDLARPAYGNFCRREWCIIGTHCGAIKSMADAVIERLSPTYRISYIDARHAGDEPKNVLPGRLRAGAVSEYTQEADFHQFNISSTLTHFDFRRLFLDTDMALVNGNHFEASAQVVVIDPAKKASLKKRMSQVDNLQMIVLAEESLEVFDFVKEAYPDWEQIPCYRISETERIAGFFEAAMQRLIPPLKGLVLAGGKSVRMGADKGRINWYGKEQRYYMADLLNELCEGVFISCRAGQETDIDHRYMVLADSFTGLGPVGALLSAFRQFPDAAWLVVACDMPLLDRATLKCLCENRRSRGIATCFESPFDGMPEPLVTIWEPKSYPVLLSFLSQGYSCPRKVLLNNEVHLLKPPDIDAIMNVNTVDEAKKARVILERKAGS